MTRFDSKFWHLYRVPRRKWCGVRLINVLKAYHHDGYFMRQLLNDEWYYRDALPSELTSD